jgi:hypothetical protein
MERDSKIELNNVKFDYFVKYSSPGEMQIDRQLAAM